MSTTPQPSPTPQAESCPQCGESLITGRAFCPNCGLLVGATPDAIALRAYVDARLREELQARVRDNGGVVRDLADRVEDVVWTRIGRYARIAGWGLAAIAALVAAIGWKSYADIKSSVLTQIQPAVQKIEERTTTVSKNIDDLQNRLPRVSASLNQVEVEASAQKNRVESADSRLSISLHGLDSAQARAKADSDQFDRQLQANKQQLDDLTKRSQAQIAQVASAATKVSIVKAYPNLNQVPQIFVGEQEVDLKNKKPGEKWVNLVISFAAIMENTYSQEQIEHIETTLNQQGFRVFIDSIHLTGRMNNGLEKLAAQPYQLDSGVFYYDRFKEAEASQVLASAGKYVSTLGPRPILVDKIPEIGPLKTVMLYVNEHSGIDVQVFLGPASVK